MKNTVKLNREFRYAYRKGTKVVTDCLVCYSYSNRQSFNKLGITVSASIGKAVCRNRIKRLIRAAYSARKDELQTGHNIIVVARSKMTEASFEETLKAFDYSLRKMGLL
ncbi:MAG: ribonuclease P protein component [Clostridia bacterium]|nr:ribonuclease P protein component [Clostridia bacterium]